MIDIVALLQCLCPHLSATTVRQLSHIIQAMLADDRSSNHVGRGPRRKYGKKVDYDNISPRYLKHSRVEDDIQTNIHQAQMLHKEFAQPLNVVIIVKRNLKTH